MQLARRLAINKEEESKLMNRKISLVLVFLLYTAAAFAVATSPRYSSLIVNSGSVPPGGSVSLGAIVNSYHLDIHKITVTADSMNGKGRIDIYSKATFLAADRLYSRTFTGSFVDPDGVIRTEGFALVYADKDPDAHTDRLLHILFTNTSSQNRTYTAVFNYEASDSGVLDIRQFGAIGNGIHDDTAAIQAAINEAFTTERTVFFPEGRWIITSSLVLDMAPLFRQEIWLEGVGSRSTIINRSPSGNPALKILNKAHFHVRKLAIVGRPDVINEAIYIGGANRSGYGTLDDLDLNPNGIGIHFQDTNTVTVDRVRYQQGGSLVGYIVGAPTANLKHAILADGIGSVNEIYIRALFSSGYASKNDGGSGIKWDTSDVSTGMRVIDCDLEGSTENPKRAIDFHNVFNFSVEDSFVENAEINIVSSRHGFLKANDGGDYKFGDGTPAGACVGRIRSEFYSRRKQPKYSCYRWNFR
jgi:pectate lyase-like protein